MSIKRTIPTENEYFEENHRLVLFFKVFGHSRFGGPLKINYIHMNKKIIIGRTDKIDLPDLEIFNVNAKIDTGAYTSSIHCTRIKLIGDVLHFQVPGLGDKEIKDFQTETFSIKKIKSSNGKAESRFTIKTHILLFGHTYQTEFSLTDRSKMKNPVLLGRQVLMKRFIVDVSKKDLSYNLKR